MPAGVPWREYLKFFTSSMLAMMFGAQIVHMYYRPLDDLNKYVETEMKMRDKKN